MNKLALRVLCTLLLVFVWCASFATNAALVSSASNEGATKNTRYLWHSPPAPAMFALPAFGSVRSAMQESEPPEFTHRWKIDLQGGKTTVSKILTYDLLPEPLDLPLVGPVQVWGFAGINVANQAPLGGFAAVKEFDATDGIRAFAGIQWQMQNDAATGFAPFVGFTLRF